MNSLDYILEIMDLKAEMCSHAVGCGNLSMGARFIDGWGTGAKMAIQSFILDNMTEPIPILMYTLDNPAITGHD